MDAAPSPEGAERMLIIPRRKGESIVIGDDIVLVVVEIRGDKVRLGIDLPRDMSLHRKEVLDAIRRAEMTSPSRTDAREGR
jgi:carbon storage regulator